MADIAADQTRQVSRAGDGRWDVFISHASEDKDQLVRALAHALSDLGASVWYDEFSLRPGDSLRSSIDHGLAHSAVGLVVLSPNFIGKAWPERELSGLTALALADRARIIPIWHQIGLGEVLNFSPPLADVLAIPTANQTAAELAIKLLAQIRPDLYSALPRDALLRRASGAAFEELQAELEAATEQLVDFQCPYCKAALVSRTDAPVDDAHKHWDTIDVYACGFEIFGGEIKQLCPADPKYPAFSDYDVRFHAVGEGWMAIAEPANARARRLSLNPQPGATQEAALAALKENYRRYAPARLHPA